MDSRKPVLLTGATGYVGGRLLRVLNERGIPVRCMARSPERIEGRYEGVEVRRGDAFDFDSLRRCMDGADSAYYLIHSLNSGKDFAEEERKSAHHFGRAARECGLRRIIYLGGLGNPLDELSPHLRSRQEAGAILRGYATQVVEFRASIVIGSGSLSFEMIRALVERLPIMVTPKWVSAEAQPIFINDVIEYLAAALDSPAAGHRVYEIGGAGRASYEGIMREYARQRGLTRRMIRVPLLTPRLSGLWLGLVTPLHYRVGRKLIESIQNATVVEDDSALRDFPVRPLGLREAIAQALENENRAFAETRWSDAYSSGVRQRDWTDYPFGTRLFDTREVAVPVPPEKAFEPIRRIGGKTGWYYGDWLWKIRGWLDLLVGGIGMRRGRRDPEWVLPGDTIDFWRVEAIEPNRHLRLRAEMKLPGRAWLEFEVTPDGPGSRVRQTAIFDPAGLLGLAYWYSLAPVHCVMFAKMLNRIALRAEAPAGAKETESGKNPKLK